MFYSKKSVGKSVGNTFCGVGLECFMKKSILGLFSSFLILLSFNSCSVTVEKTTSLLGVYIASVAISFGLLLGYFLAIKKRDLWFVILFFCVFIVNISYLWLAISDTLETALMANRVSYLGSVFLPMAMLMIITKAIKLNYNKALPYVLLVIGILVFLVAASPGYLDLYYKEVTLEIVNGVSVLNKIYGPWHITYYIYLFAYFAAMIVIITKASVKKLVSTSGQAVILTFAVMVNIGVWLLEQLVDFGFELLSISYIISELFLLGLNYLIQDEEKRKSALSPPADTAVKRIENIVDIQEEQHPIISEDSEKIEFFQKGITTLTATEKKIFELYLDSNGTKDVLTKMNIKENTLKYHNKNIYGKLGVSSRKQLLEIANKIPKS